MKSTQTKSVPVASVQRNCMICNKEVEGFYGSWGSTGTCSRKCEQVQERIAGKAFNTLVNAIRAKEGKNEP